jgi:hypothetical protein
MVGRTCKKPSGHLMPLRQQDDESLKDFVMRFNQEKLFAESPTDEMVYVALYQGIRVDGPLMAQLAHRQPETLLEFMDKVEEFINQEETLTAILSYGKIQVSDPENPKRKKKKKKKNPQGEQTTETKPRKKFKDYNFTPLNKSIHEVLMEVRKDPNYIRLPRITGNPPNKNKDKYCAFHEVNGHNTEDCIALRVMIETFVGNGKLVRFLSLQSTEPNLDKNETDNLRMIRLRTISAGLHPLEIIGVKKIGLGSMTEEGRSHEGNEAGIKALGNQNPEISMA